jgi:acetyl-CoA C-acetyltransferase
MISDPINLFDAAPIADGAAAVLLTRRELLPNISPLPFVRISGSSMANDRLALHDRVDMLEWNAVRLSVERACRQAGIRRKMLISLSFSMPLSTLHSPWKLPD